MPRILPRTEAPLKMTMYRDLGGSGRPVLIEQGKLVNTNVRVIVRSGTGSWKSARPVIPSS